MSDTPHYLSTAKVARALGVGVSSVKRWVDEEILPAYRTPGGHRKVLLTDVLRLAREGTFPNLDLSKLGGPDADRLPKPAALCAHLTRALEHGRADDVRCLLHRAFYGGLSLTTLADAVVAPAMARVGHDWETGKIDVLHEHRGTLILSGVLHELKAVLEDQVRPYRQNRPVAVGGSPEGDPYLLANLLIELLLLEMGWQVVNLGPNTPMPSFTKALDVFRPQLLWLSVSYLGDEGRFRREYADLYRRAEEGKVPVALGGQALKEDLRAALKCEKLGDNLADLAAFAKALHTPPARAPRGRPRGRRTGGS